MRKGPNFLSLSLLYVLAGKHPLQRVEKVEQRLDNVDKQIRDINVKLTQILAALNLGNKQTIIDYEKEEDLGVQQNPRVVKKTDFGLNKKHQEDTPLRVYKRRNRDVQGESKVQNSRREQYEGISHEMEARGKLPQAATPIFREGDEVVDSLKATIVEIKELVLQINQGMKDHEKDCRLVLEQHVFDVEHKVEVLGQEKTVGNLTFARLKRIYVFGVYQNHRKKESYNIGRVSSTATKLGMSFLQVEEIDVGYVVI
ncbi:hypothetical protein FNV43_RR17158 [Rhamnella rubrinervis]|uniref:Uncharacterized protein n=1 Tax=Rhamnella rubrinervis TaxID=2594499 RepID=A0A8K0GVI4_9ROSA|nr:hypothetical protein FNV43_RR17158 [Rhamnella rubrinervis]